VKAEGRKQKRNNTEDAESGKHRVQERRGRPGTLSVLQE
jgi:hypothetical protein